MLRHKSLRLSLWSFAILLAPILVPILMIAGAFGVAEARPVVEDQVLNVKIGTDIDYAPYSVINAAGEVDGFAIDLLKAVARLGGLRLQYQVEPWYKLREMLAEGEVDMVPLMAKSRERASEVDFSESLLFTFDSIFVRANETKIRSQADLAGKRIIVQSGDLAEDFLRRSGLAREIISVTTPQNAMNLLRTHGGDAVICSEVVGLTELTTEKIADVRLADEPHFGGYEREFAFAVHRGDQELLRRLNEGLRQVMANGSYSDIYSKWFSRVDPELIRQNDRRSKLELLVMLALMGSIVCGGFLLVMRGEIQRKTRSLTDSEERYRSLVENLPGLMIRVSIIENPFTHEKRRQIVYMSDAAEKITGYPVRDFLDGVRTFTSLVHPEDYPRYRQTLERLFSRVDRFSLDLRILNRKGEVVWLHACGNSAAQVNKQMSKKDDQASPEVQYADAIFIDISEQKRVADLLTEHQSKMAASARLSALGEMAGGIAHEINNPLAIINLRVHQLVRLAAKGAVEGQAAARIGTQIEATAIRISKIIRSLQTVAREAENDPYETVRVRNLLSEVFELCYQRMRKHDIDIGIEDYNTELSLECNRVQISQVLINLLNNAFDAVIEERSRWIRVDVREVIWKGLASLRFEVSDSGRGIDEKVSQKIFQPFFTTKEVGKGTGLGLSISKGIIEGHGGSIWLDQDSSVTRFMFVLPRLQKTVASRNRAQVKPPAPVIDDLML